MRSVIRISIAAPVERIFGLAVDVERWPERLPHYRYVRRLPRRAGDREGDRRYAMGARRGRIPVSWRAVQRPRPELGEIEFEHVGGFTTGMQVRWRLIPTPDAVDVSIEHQLELRVPLVGELIAERIVGRQFVEPIAGRTLRTIKQLAEAAP